MDNPILTTSRITNTELRSGRQSSITQTRRDCNHSEQLRRYQGPEMTELSRFFISAMVSKGHKLETTVAKTTPRKNKEMEHSVGHGHARREKRSPVAAQRTCSALNKVRKSPQHSQAHYGNLNFTWEIIGPVSTPIALLRKS